MKKLLILIIFILCSCGVQPEIKGVVLEEDMVGALIDSINDEAIESKTIAYTDDNKDETFIIKTDNSDYVSMGGRVGVYYSVTNVSLEDQDADIVFSLGKDQDVHNVTRFVENEATYKIIPAIATSSEQRIETLTPKWEELSFNEKFDIKDVALTRKDTKSREINKVFSDSFKSGETKYYRSEMSIPYGITEHEWFIEVAGEKGAYGHLR